VKIKKNNISVCFSYPVFAFLRKGLNPQEELSKGSDESLGKARRILIRYIFKLGREGRSSFYGIIQQTPSEKAKHLREFFTDGRNMVTGTIEELLSDFDHFVDYFYENCPFSFKQYYFHKKVIEKIRREEYRHLITDKNFLKDVYRVVLEWMGERGKGKLVAFDSFLDKIGSVGESQRELQELLEKLSDLRLHELDGEKWEKWKSSVEKLFKKVWDLKLREGSESQIVTASKTLHHLLPDLIPPIDRMYTLKFFSLHYISNYRIPPRILEDKNPERIREYRRDRETKQFAEVLGTFHDISRKLGLTEKNLKREWDTSIPKLIDNAIIGYVLRTTRKI